MLIYRAPDHVPHPPPNVYLERRSLQRREDRLPQPRGNLPNLHRPRGRRAALCGRVDHIHLCARYAPHRLRTE